MESRVFSASIEELDNVSSFVEEELEKADCGMRAQMQIAVALEEMFVNVAHYAYSGESGTVTVGVGVADGVASISLTDSGVAFDPLAKTDPDISLSAEERGIGGLGIYMVKKSMDDVKYERVENKNVFTMFKKI